MTPDKQTTAMARYKAMAGKMKGLPVAAARRAKADQKRYGEDYLPKRGKAIHGPLKTARFLVDVCGLSLKDAIWAVRRDLEAVREQPWEPQGESPADMAGKLYRATGDMMEAVSLARFYGWFSFHPDFWIDVRDRLVSMTVTEEATGIENWKVDAVKEAADD